MTVKNLTADPRTARVNVLVPEGLEATSASQTVELAGWKDATLKVPVVNRTALVGSRYPVFVTVEYDDGGVHQAVVAQGIVAVTAAGSFVDRWGRTLWIGGGRAARPAGSRALAMRTLRRAAHLMTRRPARAASLRAAIDVAAVGAARRLHRVVLPARAHVLAHHHQRRRHGVALLPRACTCGDTLLPKGAGERVVSGQLLRLSRSSSSTSRCPFLSWPRCRRSCRTPSRSSSARCSARFLMPICAYFGLRLLGSPFPGPAIGALATLCFLFMEANSMWGGNIPSTLAGEFSLSLGLSLTVLFFGTIHRADRARAAAWRGTGCSRR